MEQTKTNEIREKILQEVEDVLNRIESLSMYETVYRTYGYGKIPYDAEDKKEIKTKIDEIHQKVRKKLEQKEVLETKKEEKKPSEEEKEENKRVFNQEMSEYSEEVLSGRYTE